MPTPLSEMPPASSSTRCTSNTCESVPTTQRRPYSFSSIMSSSILLLGLLWGFSWSISAERICILSNPPLDSFWSPKPYKLPAMYLMPRERLGTKPLLPALILICRPVFKIRYIGNCWFWLRSRQSFKGNTTEIEICLGSVAVAESPRLATVFSSLHLHIHTQPFSYC